MTNRLLNLAVCAIFLSQLSCQSVLYGNASRLDRLALGMTKTQVIDAVGNPISTSVDGDKGEEHLIYKKMKSTFSMWARTYDLTLRNNKLVRWGEQYQEQNINTF